MSVQKSKKHCFEPHKWSFLPLNKKELRKKCLLVRAGIAEKERSEAAQYATTLLLDHDVFLHSHNIACYLANKNEFEMRFIIQAIWRAGKNCYLPVLTANDHLAFAAYHENTVLKPNSYHIDEPVDEMTLPPEALDLAIVPLVGFDLSGGRLGMGGGYYDKTFSFLLKKNASKPFFLGLAYEIQKMDQIPVDTWDVPLDGVLTEKKLYLF